MKSVVEVVSTFGLRKLAQRDSSRYDQTAMEFQPLLDQSPGSRSGHGQLIADKHPEHRVQQTCTAQSWKCEPACTTKVQ